MLKIAEPITEKFYMFRSTTISEFETTITEVPHENLPNTTMPKNFSLLGAKNVRHYHTLPSPRQTLIPNTPLWVRVSKGNENTQRGWSRFKLTDQL